MFHVTRSSSTRLFYAAYALLTINLISVSSNAAARPLADKAGWGADLGITVGFTQQQSQFNVDDDNAVTTNLSNSGKETRGGQLLPLARLDFTLDSLKTQYYVGNSRENVGKGAFQIEVGGSHQFEDNSILTLAYFPKLPFIGETWKDPYLTNQTREKTDETAQGGRIKLKNIAGSYLDVQYAFADSDIDTELSGSSLAQLTDSDRSKLHRDAFYQRVTIDQMLSISDNVIIQPGIMYTHANAKGEANGHDEYALRLQVIYWKTRHLVTGTALYGRLKASIDNPVFNKREKTDRASLFALYKYKKPFNLDNWSLMAIGFWGETDSNITFYNRSGAGLGIGATYEWR
ncbi:DUF2860 domain-containing protein [Alkalimarinus alittae]|uniref:DUF2860 domain-containing protein n=1 Tax=Alkalimarinus alittae TaxID=2961619 RepID=A0ABY6N736_9ALTE|nr:DUF2860 domain-containing protein [Alkalimarinus alittae]UZE97923.1 DUF2860 domain-containing protein [Alkalimarinus alittae]